MKMNCKNILFFGVITVFALPGIIFAANRTATSAPGNGGVGQSSEGNTNDCKMYLDRSLMIDQKIAESGSKLEAKRAETMNKVMNLREKRNQQREKNRSNWSENRGEHFEALEAKAGTDAQKQAVLKFRQTVEAAIATRQLAIDKAVQTYRQGIDQALTARKSSVDVAVNAYKIAVSTAFKNAKDSCLAGVSQKTFKASLTVSLKAARDKFSKDKKIIEKPKVSTEALVTARKQAIEKAIGDFKAQMERAKTELKAAFPEQ